MKNITAIITAIIIALCAMTATATADPYHHDTYTLTAVVTSMEVAFGTVWEVTATTADGDMYGWYSEQDEEEYWHVGDLVVLTMLDQSREHEEEDEVMDVEYIDTLTPQAVARWLTH